MNQISLLPFGAGLAFEQDFYEKRDEIIVAIAGPIFNFLCSLIIVAFWWMFPEIMPATENLVYANFITGVINLLPCYPLDGGRIFLGLLSQKISRKKAIKVALIINYIFSVIFFILFIITFSSLNITFLLMSIFIFIGTFGSKFNGKYEVCNFCFSNIIKHKNKIPIHQFGVSGDIMLFKLAGLLDRKKYNIIYVFNGEKIKTISQNQLEKIFLKNKINTKLNEIN